MILNFDSQVEVSNQSIQRAAKAGSLSRHFGTNTTEVKYSNNEKFETLSTRKQKVIEKFHKPEPEAIKKKQLTSPSDFKTISFRPPQVKVMNKKSEDCSSPFSRKKRSQWS